MTSRFSLLFFPAHPPFLSRNLLHHATLCSIFFFALSVSGTQKLNHLSFQVLPIFLKKVLISHNLPCNLASIMAVVAYLVLLLAMSGQSSALYCLCKEGLNQTVLQKAMDYACGAGADCTQILQNGPCFTPNTVHDHCNYAVNSYFQRKGQTTGSCDFAGTAITNANPPQNVVSGCVYASSVSTGTTPGTMPSTTTPSIPGSLGGTTLGPTGSGTGGINDDSGGPRLKQTSLILSFALSVWVSSTVLQ